MRDLSKKHVSGCVDPLRKKVHSIGNREFAKIRLHHPSVGTGVVRDTHPL